MHTVYVVYMNACYLLVIKLNYKKSIVKFVFFAPGTEHSVSTIKDIETPPFDFIFTLIHFTLPKFIHENIFQNNNPDDDIPFLLFFIAYTQGCESRRQTFSSITRPTFREI